MNNKNYTDQIENNKFVRLPDILSMLSISRKTWFEWIKDGHAPEPVRFGPKTFRWHENDIKQYLNKNYHLEDNKED